MRRKLKENKLTSYFFKPLTVFTQKHLTVITQFSISCKKKGG
ncbi:hypothetical protein DDD_3126 [Nonlabens dokdonensis DSW-6]|uniref:Uncharacterized protein n=1 Tax=Nonlabens dokdonensis (strain DSM 17205 / KCTC 12402 / DSW-6) TaxID=592029 RepID=L7WH21_NONDD|nr:hypothetical protein DDD_3126 [Nonlabens dokdonensis DSW-6]